MSSNRLAASIISAVTLRWWLRRSRDWQLATTRQLSQLERNMTLILDTLEAKLTQLEDADDRMIALLSTIHNELVDARASGDPARLDAVIASMSTEQQKIIDAMNTNPDPDAVKAAQEGTPPPQPTPPAMPTQPATTPEPAPPLSTDVGTSSPPEPGATSNDTVSGAAANDTIVGARRR